MPATLYPIRLTISKSGGSYLQLVQSGTIEVFETGTSNQIDLFDTEGTPVANPYSFATPEIVLYTESQQVDIQITSGAFSKLIEGYQVGYDNQSLALQSELDALDVRVTTNEDAIAALPVTLVASVNSQTGAVVLDADDIDDTSTIHKFATVAQLAAAESALQSGDDISALTNNAGFITAAESPVLSVNSKTSAVVLDADDIDDSSTTHKFASAAQLANADSALQSGDNISELVNDAGYLVAGSIGLSDLSDVIYTPAPEANFVLKWDAVNSRFFPDSLDKFDIGLGNVQNLAPANLPISTATQTALDAKLQAGDNVSELVNDAGYLATGDNVSELVNDAGYITGISGASIGDLNDVNITGITQGQSLFYSDLDSKFYPLTLNKNTVGLANVDNTSDVSKPISTATQTALDAKLDIGANVSELVNDAAYITAAESPVLSVNSQTSHVTLTKSDLGLGSVDNTSDALKPISNATQAALDAKVNITNHYLFDTFQTGGAGNPSISFNGQPDTQINCNPSLGYLDFRVNNTSCLLIDFDEISVGGLPVRNVALPTIQYDAVNKNYVDAIQCVDISADNDAALLFKDVTADPTTGANQFNFRRVKVQATDVLRIDTGADTLQWRFFPQFLGIDELKDFTSQTPADGEALRWSVVNDRFDLVDLSDDFVDKTSAQTIAGNKTFTGTTTFDSGTSTNVIIKCDDSGQAVLALYGDAQGTGRLFVGQSTTHGGGIEYNGDGSPVGSGSDSDYVTLYRVEAGTYTWTARNKYNLNDWEFRGDVYANTSNKLATESHVSTNYSSLSGNQTITGDKTHSGDIIMSADARIKLDGTGTYLEPALTFNGENDGILGIGVSDGGRNPDALSFIANSVQSVIMSDTGVVVLVTLNMSSNNISGLADPTSGDHAATKAYVDNSGPTGNRPASPSTGQSYFDTTIGKPVWYNGSGWVDATGTSA